MAILQGQAARDYLAQNPQANYRALAPEEVTSMMPRKRGLLENLGLGLTKPFRGLAEQVMSVGGFLVDPTKPIENRNLALLTDEEEQIFRENPLLAGTQYGAGIGAFAVPGGGAFGGGLKGAIASGAASGTLGGFGGANREEDIARSTAMGGGLGALFGAGTYGIGKGVQALKNKGRTAGGIVRSSSDDANAILESVTKEGPKAGGEFLTGGKIATDNLDELRRTFDALPEGDMTKQAMKSLYGFGDDAASLGDDILNRVPAKLQGTSDDVVSQFDDTLDDILQNSPAEQKRQALEKLLKAIPDSEPLAPALKNQVTGALDELPLNVPKSQNWLQKTGRDIEYGGMGIKAKPGDLNYAGQVDLDKNAIDWGLDMAQKQGMIKNASLSHQNMSKIPEALGKIRQDALKDISIKVSTSDLIDDLSPVMAQRLRIPEEQARSIMNSQLQNYITKGGGSNMLRGMSPDDIMQGRFVLDQNALHKITQDWGDEAFRTNNLWNKGAPNITPGSEAKRLVNEYAVTTLKDASPVYRNANRAFNALYRQNTNLVNAANRGQISVTGGRAAVTQQIQPWAERQLGKVMQGVGNLQAKLPNVNLSGAVDLLGSPAMQRMAPIAAATTIPQMGQQTMAGQQSQGDVLGTSNMQNMMNMMPAPGSYPQMGGSPQMMIQSNPGAQQMIAMQLLSSGMSPSDVKLTMELLGITSPESTMTTDQKKMLTNLDNAENMLNILDSQLAGVGTADFAPGARISGIFKNIAGDIGLNPEAATYEDTRQGFASRIARALGETGTLNDKDIERAINLLPKLSDSTREAQVKLEQLRGIIADARLNTVSY